MDGAIRSYYQQDLTDSQGWSLAGGDFDPVNPSQQYLRLPLVRCTQECTLPHLFQDFGLFRHLERLPVVREHC